jgi:hypothetical protein
MLCVHRVVSEVRHLTWPSCPCPDHRALPLLDTCYSAQTRRDTVPDQLGMKIQQALRAFTLKGWTTPENNTVFPNLFWARYLIE